MRGLTTITRWLLLGGKRWRIFGHHRTTSGITLSGRVAPRSPAETVLPAMPHTSFRFAFALIFAVVITGCTTPNPNYRKPVDASNPTCTTNASCAAPTGVCNRPTGAEMGQCVQCTATEATACEGTTPICGTDNACRGCSAHSECASAVCLPTGACSDGTDVAFVAPSGTGTQCTKAMPCPTLEAGLNTKRPYVKLTGSIVGNVSIKDQTVTLLADRGAQLKTGRQADVIQISGNSQVSVFDLEIVGALALSANGISMPRGNTATVTLQNVLVSDNDGGGLAIADGTLNVVQCTIKRNNGGGVLPEGGTLNIMRSTITANYDGVLARGGTINIERSALRDNIGGGVTVVNSGLSLNILQSTLSGNTGGGIVMLNTSAFHIANNLIVGNGTSSGAAPSDTGGIKARPQAGSNSSIEFNTIVDNQAGAASAVSAGLDCQGGIDASGNLIFRNTGGAGNPQTTAGCNYGNSLLTAPSNPGFAGNGDYHLTGDTPSSIRDAVDCAGNTKDVDNDSRPQGAKCDLGADEYTSARP